MNIHKKNYFLILTFLLFLINCSTERKVEQFNFKMEGVPVGYLSVTKEVYLNKENEVVIRLSKEDESNIKRFIGNEDKVELTLYLGKKEIDEFTIFNVPSYKTLRFWYKDRYASIFENAGIEVIKGRFD